MWLGVREYGRVVTTWTRSHNLKPFKLSPYNYGKRDGLIEIWPLIIREKGIPKRKFMIGYGLWLMIVRVFQPRMKRDTIELVPNCFDQNLKLIGNQVSSENHMNWW